MDTINSISANVPCTQKTGIYKKNNDYFNAKYTTTTTKTVKVQRIGLWDNACWNEDRELEACREGGNEFQRATEWGKNE